MTDKRALFVGESWTVHSIHQKGFDSFTTTEYAEGGGWLRAALEAGGWTVTYQPSHVAAVDFPSTVDELGRYDCVILSDIGANTLLIHPETFRLGKALPDRLQTLHDWVVAGGGLVMVGGYLSFQGIDAKARFANTPVERALPVTMLDRDDRAERPAGVTPLLCLKDHPLVADVPGDWPDLLGYNVVSPRPEAEVIATVDGDPLLATWTYGRGRAVAFTSDCGPHWAPQPFVDWDGYAPMWQGIASWAAGRIG
ncbi:glutamine amidotransferase [Phytohabitans sp. ZYX-F-186]|uniref:Glutamine amidotransferase n=1 Tax=Phytohabitans maris TaxID=3071409 RepID=A0ABU0ZY66_9ACTN|nr:glutamine amidotransferase [Phytohabitans sp. ZYX-F-186]MDQ7911120.1 glutamine amidotransferase [Phytohabitans sp. ZYX-F-186]